MMAIVGAVDAAGEGDLWGVIEYAFGGVIPEVLLVGVICSVILIAIWMNSQSVVLTGVTAMLSGAVIVEFLPPEVRMAGYLVILAAVAAVATSIYASQPTGV